MRYAVPTVWLLLPLPLVGQLMWMVVYLSSIPNARRQGWHDKAASTLVVVAYPSRGLDVASVRATQQLLLDRRAAGAGVLMVSEDIDELLALADRIVVLHDGEVAGIVDPSTTDRQAIGRLMLQGAAA